MTYELRQAAANRFTAVCDAWIAQAPATKHHAPAELWGLSIIGAQTAVKAVAAAILKSDPDTAVLSPASPENDGKTLYVTRAPESGKWRSKTARLRLSRAWHCIIYPAMAEYEPPEEADGSFLLLSWGADAKPAEKHRRFLSRRTDVPLHPAWTGWLWLRALETGEARPLESSSNVQAWLCTPEEESLKADLSPAVASGELAIPEIRTARA